MWLVAKELPGISAAHDKVLPAGGSGSGGSYEGTALLRALAA